jgi:hypothetical protein
VPIAYRKLIGNLSAVYRQNNDSFYKFFQPPGAMPGGFHLAGFHTLDARHDSKEIL